MLPLAVSLGDPAGIGPEVVAKSWENRHVEGLPPFVAIGDRVYGAVSGRLGDQFGEDTALACMQAAYDAGVNFFDNAEAYSMGESETIMGRVLQKTGWKRSDLVISTKIFWGGEGPNDKGLSRKHIVEGTQAALRRLQLDYVDLIFCHRPDYETPIEETVGEMAKLIEEGKIRAIGLSEAGAATPPSRTKRADISPALAGPTNLRRLDHYTEDQQ